MAALTNPNNDMFDAQGNAFDRVYDSRHEDKDTADFRAPRNAHCRPVAFLGVRCGGGDVRRARVRVTHRHV